MTKKKKSARYLVYSIPLKPRGKLRDNRDFALEEFGEALMSVLNEADTHSCRVTMLQYIENRGIVVCVDSQPIPSFPGMTIAAVPMVTKEDSEIGIHPRLQQALDDFTSYAVSRSIVRGSNEESRELENYLAKALSSNTAEEIRGMLETLEEKYKQHFQHCEDVNCSVSKFLQLTSERLRSILKVRLQ